MPPPPPFVKGQEVEVKCLGEGFYDAWYEARVIRASGSSRRRRYFVEYDTLLDDGDPSRRLSESVCALHLRPRPPLHAHGAGFTLHQLVEAYYNDGWWAGVVARLPETKKGTGSGKYRVCFPKSREEMEFAPEEFRPQLDWVGNNEWVPCLVEQEITETTYSQGTPVEVDRATGKLPSVWFPAVVVKKISRNIVLIEYGSMPTGNGLPLRELVDVSYVRPSPSDTLVVRTFNLDTAVEVFHKGGWWQGVIDEILPGPSYCVKFIHDMGPYEFSHTELRLPYDWISGEWVLASQGNFIRPKKSREKKPVDHNNTESQMLTRAITASSSRNNVPCTLRLCDVSSKCQKISRSRFRNQLESLHPDKKLKKEEELKDTTDLLNCLLLARGSRSPCPRMEETELGITTPVLEETPVSFRSFIIDKFGRDTSTLLNDHLTSLSTSQNQDKNISQCSAGEKRRKGGKPQNLSMVLANASLKGHEPQECEGSYIERIEGADEEEFVDLASICRDIVSHDRELLSIGLTKKRNASEDDNTPKKSREDKNSNMVDEQSIEESPTFQLELTTLVDRCNELLEAQISPSVVVGSGAQLVETSNSCILSHKIRNGGPKNVVSSLEGQMGNRVLDGICNSVSVTNRPLLFERTSLVWETFESMEIFKVMPQEPHFLPLDEYREDLRERRAIGLMVTFTGFIDSVRKLTIADSHGRLVEKLETVEHLERHGFSVKALRARLEELLSLKSTHEEYVRKKSSLEVLMSEKQLEKDRLKLKIEQIDKTITRFQQLCSQFFQKKASLLKEYEENEQELAQIHMDASDFEGVISAAEHDFEGLCSSSF